MRFLLITLGIGILPTLSHAQTALPTNDVTFSIGWSGAEYDAIGEYDRWRGSLLLGASAGHYWTDHLKTEVEAAWNSRTTSEVYQEIVIGTSRTYAIADYTVDDLRFSFGQLYQFGRNEWIHPFVGAGADVVRRDTHLARPTQTRPGFPGGSQRSLDVGIPALGEQNVEILVRPFLKGGWKMYVTDRAYFSTELKFGFAPDLDHALWKIGIGFDF